LRAAARSSRNIRRAKRRSHTGEELIHAEWLCDIVIGAEVKRFHFPGQRLQLVKRVRLVEPDFQDEKTNGEHGEGGTGGDVVPVTVTGFDEVGVIVSGTAWYGGHGVNVCYPAGDGTGTSCGGQAPVMFLSSNKLADLLVK